MKISIPTIIFSIILVSSSPNVANAESVITPINEKYTIVKNIGWGPWWSDTISTVEINLSDSRNNTTYESGFKTLDVHISDFVATSKGKASGAKDILSNSLIDVLSINPSDGVITERQEGNQIIKVINLSKDITKFKIDILTTERDTVTYSGKILLKNESELISIPVDIVIQHDVNELIVAALIGVGLGIGISFLFVRVIFTKKLDFSDDKPWLSIALITFVGVPSSVFINTGFIGNVGLDIVIAFSIGLIIITKLLKRKESTSNKITLSFDAEKNLPVRKQKILDDILKDISGFSKMK